MLCKDDLVKTQVFDYELYVWQKPTLFNYCLESVLLPCFVKVNRRIQRILDVGTNNAVIPLILHHKYHSKLIDGIEIQPEPATIAQWNLKMNNVQLEKVRILYGDVRDYASECRFKYQMVLCNPPYFKTETHRKMKQKSVMLQQARHEIHLKFEQLVEAVAKLIDNKGVFALVHRTERLDEVLLLLDKYGFVAKRLMMIHPYSDRQASLFLLEAQYHTPNRGLIVLPPLISHAQDGSYSQAVYKMMHANEQ